jgi:DNA-binding CsgD family transcriptional regulator
VKVVPSQKDLAHTTTKEYRTMKINSRFTKVAVAAGLVVATGAGVLGLTGFASAQMANNSGAVVVASDGATTIDGLGNLEASGSATPSSGDVAAQGTITDDHANRPNPVAEAATALGMTEAELTTELQAGKSIADVAKAKNVDLDKVIAALTASFKAHLDEEVASGEHTQAEADAKLAEFKTRVTTMVNTAGLPMHGGKGGHGPMGGKGGAPFATAKLATTLKLTEAELQTQLQSGKTLKQIADAQNVDIADVKATLTADFKAHLDEEVKSGEHTQAEADAKLAEFKTRLDDMLNGVRPAGGHGGHGGHGPHGEGQIDGATGSTTQGTGTSAQL